MIVIVMPRKPGGSLGSPGGEQNTKNSIVFNFLKSEDMILPTFINVGITLHN